MCGLVVVFGGICGMTTKYLWLDALHFVLDQQISITKPLESPKVELLCEGC